MGARLRRSLPTRERVFVLSLMYHGYRYTHQRYDLKKKKGYIIPSTKIEDSSGIDFWIKSPSSFELRPVQVTQRGVAIFRKRNKDYTHNQLAEFIARSDVRLRKKRKMCRKNKIAFVLVRDHTGASTNKTLAWGDVKALRYGIARVPH
jgi:hypothetical protein